MVADFEYDGIKLSDMGYTIVTFDGAKDGEIDTDSQYSFNHASMMMGKQQPFLTSVYDDYLIMEFYIAKNMCQHEQMEDYNISPSNMAYLKKWLIRPTPHKLKAISDAYSGYYWIGTFNVEEYVLGDGRIGAHLKFECDAPFGYKNEVTINGSLDANEYFEYNCTSDEIGWIYPELEIVVLESGNLKIKNDFDGRITSINNCMANEKITITSKLQISSDYNTHKIADDFNYVHYRVNNSMGYSLNTIESNLPIRFKIRYSPYAKVVIV